MQLFFLIYQNHAVFQAIRRKMPDINSLLSVDFISFYCPEMQVKPKKGLHSSYSKVSISAVLLFFSITLRNHQTDIEFRVVSINPHTSSLLHNRDISIKQ